MLNPGVRVSTSERMNTRILVDSGGQHVKLLEIIRKKYIVIDIKGFMAKLVVNITHINLITANIDHINTALCYFVFITAVTAAKQSKSHSLIVMISI